MAATMSKKLTFDLPAAFKTMAIGDCWLEGKIKYKLFSKVYGVDPIQPTDPAQKTPQVTVTYYFAAEADGTDPIHP
jgi:hypothetical protein